MNTEAKASDQFATYCPEDNKLRLYVGRVPREEYEALRAEGWTSTPKQDCDFVATWTPEREDTALRYGGGEIEDEDQDPGERAAARAERFAGYLGKRTAEALTHAGAYEDGPQVHGYQDPTRAERAAKRHDRQADKALSQWGKAEYWQRRTSGVIAHALYKDLPGVRMGRIKTLEAELRKREKDNREHVAHRQAVFDSVLSVVEHAAGTREKLLVCPGADFRYQLAKIKEAEGNEDDPATVEQLRRAVLSSALGGWHSPTKDKETAKAATAGTRPAHELAAEWLEGTARPEEFDGVGGRWMQHLRLRLAYENQMLEGQGGRLEQQEIEVGGKIGGKLILKTNKSRATGRVVSVALLGPGTGGRWVYKAKDIPGTEWAEHTFETERLSPDAYTPPTPESLAELESVRATIKAARDAKKGKAAPLVFVNLTREDAERLAAVWGGGGENASRARWGQDPVAVKEMTQAEYSARSKGGYAIAETKEITGGGYIRRSGGCCPLVDFPTVAKVRTLSGCPVVITDKPSKPLPAHVWEDPRPAERAEVLARLDELVEACQLSWSDKMTPEQEELFMAARRVGLAFHSSLSQFGLTDEGKAIFAERSGRKTGLATA